MNRRSFVRTLMQASSLAAVPALVHLAKLAAKKDRQPPLPSPRPENVVRVILYENQLFACCSDHEIWRSDDSGYTWTKVRFGVPVPASPDLWMVMKCSSVG